MASYVLLLQDVEHVGRSGDIASVKPGYARNFLIPQKLAIIADANARRLQKRLQEQRAEQARVDRHHAEQLAEKLSAVALHTTVKVDPEGHMYGSVAAIDIIEMLAQQGIEIERRYVQLPRAIKELGTHTITFKLKEGVTSECTLEIVAEEG